MKRAVVIGGFATGQGSLERVANTICDGLQLADDADVFTFAYAMGNPDEIGKATRNSRVFTHSAGILAVHSLVQPDTVIACNGPEPRSALRLLASGYTKVRHSLFHVAIGQLPAETHASIVRDTVEEVARNPCAYFGRIGQIGGFSTRLRLAGFENNVKVAALVSATDEFFPYRPDLDYGNVPVFVHPGGHDAFLIEPAKVLDPWVQSLAA